MSSIGLPPHYRFKVRNQTTQTIAADSIFVRAKRVKFDTNGALSYEASEATLVSSGSPLANNAYLAGTTQDNTTAQWLGGDFEFTVTAPTGANGNVTCYFERSTDAGTDWDDNGLGQIVAVLNFTAAGTKRVTFSL